MLFGTYDVRQRCLKDSLRGPQNCLKVGSEQCDVILGLVHDYLGHLSRNKGEVGGRFRGGTASPNNAPSAPIGLGIIVLFPFFHSYTLDPQLSKLSDFKVVLRLAQKHLRASWH